MCFFKRKKSLEQKYMDLLPDPIFSYLEKIYNKELAKFPNNNRRK